MAASGITPCGLVDSEPHCGNSSPVTCYDHMMKCSSSEHTIANYISLSAQYHFRVFCANLL